jgi:hypothetical protein
MRLVRIKYPTYFDDIDIENDNIDVFVELDDGMTYKLLPSIFIPIWLRSS